MEELTADIIKSWGLFGVLVVICALILYNFIKTNFIDKKNVSHTNSDVIEQTELLMTTINTSLNTSLQTSFQTIRERIDDKFDTILDRVDYLEEKLDVKVAELDEKINKLPSQNNEILLNNQIQLSKNKATLHDKAIEDIVKLGPKIFDLLNEYTIKINCTHLFLGSFHNGSESLAGIPYIKFNIIREAFNPNDPVPLDHPFAPVYKDCDLTLLGKLPALLVQKREFYFSVDENNNSSMFKYDELIVRRMIGMGIKQIAVVALIDDDVITGFLGCVKYNNDKINIDELHDCARELQYIHNK